MDDVFFQIIKAYLSDMVFIIIYGLIFGFAIGLIKDFYLKFKKF